MTEQTDHIPMLELIMTPAFGVRQGQIVHVNQAARQLLIEPGIPVESLLGPSAEAYSAFKQGCLYLTLQLPGGFIGASVTRIDGADIFVLEQEQTELRTLALAAQDLRMPVTELIGLTDQLSDALETAGCEKQLSQINKRLTQLKRLVLNMADASRYTGSDSARLSLVDFCAFMSELSQRLRVWVEAAGFALHYELPAEPIHCRLDEEKLERAVYNLISNAMKASPSGATIDMRLTRKGHTLYLSVQNSGEGIPETVLSSIFNRYQRQPGLESGQSGLGLGMVMVRTAAAVHGGTVLVTEIPEGGTRVILSIPIRTDNIGQMRSPTLRVDYAGEKDHALLELSDVLPAALYKRKD